MHFYENRSQIRALPAQDGTLEKLLSAYRLYVNGRVVGVGPGRSDAANSGANHSVYDSVDITAEVQVFYG
jgi:hypothetical protein